MIDLKLIEECRSGNLGNFRKLVELTSPFAFSVAFRMLGDEEQAKDVVQETMVIKLSGQGINSRTLKISDKQINQFIDSAIEMQGRYKDLMNLINQDTELVNLIKINDSKFDSLWSNGIILKKYMSEGDYQNFRSEADTALEKVTEQFFSMEFKEYSVRIVMPGTLTSTNGFIDSSKVLLWPVKSDFFLAEPYEMWAESKVPNNWAWIVSGLFLVFVFTGIIIRIKNKG